VGIRKETMMVKKLLTLLITLPMGLSAMDNEQWHRQLKQLAQAISIDNANETQVKDFLSQKDCTNPSELVNMATQLQPSILRKAAKAKNGNQSPEFVENARAGLYFIITVAKQIKGLPDSENLQVTQTEKLYAELKLIKREPEPFGGQKKKPSLLQSALENIFSIRGGIVLAISATLIYAYKVHKKSSITATQ